METPCTGVPSWACDACTTHKKPCTLRGQGKRAPRKGKKRARTEDAESEDEVEDAVGPSRRIVRKAKRARVVDPDEDELAAGVRRGGLSMERMAGGLREIADGWKRAVIGMGTMNAGFTQILKGLDMVATGAMGYAESQQDVADALAKVDMDTQGT